MYVRNNDATYMHLSISEKQARSLELHEVLVYVFILIQVNVPFLSLFLSMMRRLYLRHDE